MDDRLRAGKPSRFGGGVSGGSCALPKKCILFFGLEMPILVHSPGPLSNITKIFKENILVIFFLSYAYMNCGPGAVRSLIVNTPLSIDLHQDDLMMMQHIHRHRPNSLFALAWNYKNAVLSQREPRDAAVIFFGTPLLFHPNFGSVSDRADRRCRGQPEHLP